VLHDPGHVLSLACEALGLAFVPEMLSWPAGPRATDGVWAPAWYSAVEKSTNFSAPREGRLELTDELKRVADVVRGD
jgi:hypothetical protein